MKQLKNKFTEVKNVIFKGKNDKLRFKSRNYAQKREIKI